MKEVKERDVNGGESRNEIEKRTLHL